MGNRLSYTIKEFTNTQKSTESTLKNWLRHRNFMELQISIRFEVIDKIRVGRWNFCILVVPYHILMQKKATSSVPMLHISHLYV